MTTAMDPLKPPSTTGVSMADLYTQSPGAVETKPAAAASVAPAPQLAQATATSPGAAKTATAGGYSATTRQVAKDELSDAQLARITSTDSPLMKRARQEGILTAARRGLQNSSIAAGTAQGAMVDRAVPLALSNSQHLLTQGIANMDAQNRAEEVGATLSTQASIANSEQANKLAALNAQLQTAVSQGNAQDANNIRMEMARLQTSTSQFNAGLTQEANRATAADQNQMRITVMQENSALNRQYLSGSQAMDLATIQGRYNQLIATNESASNLYRGYFDSISQAMANKDITPERIASYVKVQQDMLEAGLRMIDQMNNVDLSGFKPPNVTTSGGQVVSMPAGTQPTAPPIMPYLPYFQGGYPF